jgi:integrase
MMRSRSSSLDARRTCSSMGFIHVGSLHAHPARHRGSAGREVRALTSGDFYADERFVPIRHGVEAGTKSKIKGTKTDNSKPGYLQQRTVQELLIWRHAESRFNSDSDFIFTKDGDAPVSGASIGDAFKRGLIGKGLNAMNWTPYYPRHTFVTQALEVLDDSEVLMLAGHTSIITNKIYRHPDDESMVRRSIKAERSSTNTRIKIIE